MADLVQRLMNYMQTFPPNGDADELKDHLNACTYRDLRTVCSRFHLPGAGQKTKKSDFISLLVSYWKGDVVPDADSEKAKESSKPDTPSDVMGEASDVSQFVQRFPLDGTAEELRDQLNGCKARTLRSACVLLELHPKKNHAKPHFVGLLVGYWQTLTAQVATLTPKSVKVAVEPSSAPKDKVDISHHKRPFEEKEKAVSSKKKKVMERTGDLFEEEKGVVLALQKAKLVKEWASAIEILSRVDGSATSIASIRALIDGVVDSAVSEL